MEKKKPFIIDVVPIVRLPLSGSQSFSYLSDTQLPIGTLVSVPLFKRKVEGVVTENRPDFSRLGNIELKKISAVIEEGFLDTKQIELAKFISNYYFSSLGVVLKAFIPKIVKARNANRTTQIANPAKNITLTQEQFSAIEKITNSDSRSTIRDTRYLLYGPAGSGKTETYIHSILKLKSIDPSLQFLIMLPELTLSPQAIERYGEYFTPEETVVINSTIPKGQLYANWKKIKSGEAKIIIGTRMSVFSPFKNLGLVVIDEEQDMSHKQWESSPRYDARIVAEKLAELHQGKIIFGSATPRTETFYRAMQNEVILLKLPELKIPNQPESPKRTIELVDMKKERWRKYFGAPKPAYSPISQLLKSEIAYALKNKLQAIIFINRQGMSNFSICTKCKTILRCPKCQRALIYDKDGTYNCVRCSYATSILHECSKCKGLTFSNIGLGTQKIEREIATLFPQARLARADSQTMQEKSAQEKLYKNFKKHAIDIIIGTQMISKGWDLPNVALIGIIDGDGMLSIPDFFTEERAYQNILQLAGRSSRPGAIFPGRVIIQTFKPEQAFFKAVSDPDFEKFYTKEIKEREILHLPPFGKIIKLTCQNYDKKKCTEKTLAIHERLLNLQAEDILFSEPQDAFIPNVRGKFRKQIILRLPSNIPIPDNLKNILTSLASDWLIDVDPISIT
jgi:primosomal protein N' (replication factor Y)